MTKKTLNSTKLRILIFNWRDLAHPLAGGAEVYTHRVAEEWIKMGHEVTLFCSSVVGKPDFEDLNGLKIIRRGGKHTVYREAKKYYKNEGRGNFDLVVDEVNTRPFATPNWVLDAEVIALIHQVCREVWFYETMLPVAIIGRYILEPFWLRSYKNVKTITISESSKKSLEDYGLRDVQYIPIGFEKNRNKFGTEKEIDPTLIFVGRLAGNKRPLDAVKAFKIVKKQFPDSKFWIVGTGRLESKIRRLKVSGVEVLGRITQEDRNNRMARAHLLVITSVREGWGMVVTEAALLGTPSVGYDVPGIRDSVTSSSGLLCKANPHALALKVTEIFFAMNGVEFPTPSAEKISEWNVVAQKILRSSPKLKIEEL